MVILGLSPFRHHSSAALLQDGVITAAIENNKLMRVESPRLPEAAIRFCLNHAGLNWSDLDMVSVAMRPARHWFRRCVHAKLFTHAPLLSAYHGANEISNIAKELHDLRGLHSKWGRPRKMRHFDHHVCHAACAFYQSPFDRALIVVLDEDGDGNSGTVALGEGNKIRVLQEIKFPNSLAWVYSQVTELIGFLPGQEEHKTQWLGMQGEPLFKPIFLKMLRKPRSPLPRLNFKYLDRGLAKRFSFSDRFFREAGLPIRESLGEDLRRALARSVQEALAELITDWVDHLRSRNGIRTICFAGGLVQNPLLVASLEKSLGMDEVFVPPAPGNAGTSVGAAYLSWHQTLSNPRVEPVANAYSGPKFTGQEVKDVLDNSKSRYAIQVTEDRELDATIQLLQAGKIVGWFQGRCEFGPRALGNRSILASPWAPYVRENLNDYIKGREWFRPFAISVPEEECPRYFEFSKSCRFMNSVGWIRPDNSCLPPEFVLPGNRVRLHIVEQRSNPLFWKLLKRFGEREHGPMLVNTSFNLFGEPLVATPRDAVRSYFCSGIDALVINKFVLCKTAVAAVGAGQQQQGSLPLRQVV